MRQRGREVRLAAFLDECTQPQDGAQVIASVEYQLAVGSALGLSWWVPRWFNFGTQDKPDIVNVGKLTDAQLATVLDAQRAYGLAAHCLGSGIGKVKLRDVPDGTSVPYFEPARYLDEVVHPAAAVAEKLNVKAVRLFSFYPPPDSGQVGYIEQAVERLAPIVDIFINKRILPLLEVEANLVGNRGAACMAIAGRLWDIHRRRTLCCIWDWGNVYSQGLDPWAEWRLMEGSVAEFHAKFYDGPRPEGFGPVDEDALSHYVPPDGTRGLARPEPILSDVAGQFAAFYERALGEPAVVLEPHLLGGGRFGGVSGALGMGVALRGLCRVLDHVGLDYQLRDQRDVEALRL
ncbi:MAG: xylose isomerase domain-containing protein TIM barrel [Parcubacteria group bacterium Gr01-1014_31]|nr:MAG: xylose isomerase domain-containing protein TIM barrel [Parcubacteria group bacterium Gr01-1014_31]